MGLLQERAEIQKQSHDQVVDQITNVINELKEEQADQDIVKLHGWQDGESRYFLVAPDEELSDYVLQKLNEGVDKDIRVQHRTDERNRHLINIYPD